MIELTIPGRGLLRIAHLVIAVNGTLAVDGILINGLTKRLTSLRDRLEIHLLTADAHRRQAANDALLKLKAFRIQPQNEAMKKADLVMPDIFAALDLLDKPLRIITSLRK